MMQAAKRNVLTTADIKDNIAKVCPIFSEQLCRWGKPVTPVVTLHYDRKDEPCNPESRMWRPALQVYMH